MNLVEQLVIHEGAVKKDGKHRLYRCTAGKNTLAYGHNLDDNGLSEDAARFILSEDIEIAKGDCIKFIPYFNNLDKVRQDALINMCFNMGITRLLTFKNMLRALQEKKYAEARLHALDSKWAVQVGKRSEDIGHMLAYGIYP